MKKTAAILTTLLFCLLSNSLYAAEKDAADCKDHPLVPRLPGYFIVGCADGMASFDMETVKEKFPETIHVEGKSQAVRYRLQPEITSKPDKPELLRIFEQSVKKYDGTLVGMVNSIPVYRLVNGGKEVWVVVLADNVGGGHAFRVIAKEDLVQTEKAEAENDALNCRQYGPPFFAPIPGYMVRGCGGSESSNRQIKFVKGKTPGTVRVQGKLTEMVYTPKNERKLKLSELDIRRHFENEIKKRGGAFIGNSVKEPGIDIYRLTEDGKDTWIEVWTETTGDYNYVVTR